jgi:hypothetical protein
MIQVDTEEIIGQLAEADHDSACCMRLWMAVLKLALQDYAMMYQANGCKHDAIAVQRHPSARWIADTSNHRQGFNWVCELLGMNPDAVRNSFYRNASDITWIGRGYKPDPEFTH